jgi:hypothetical protein
LAKYCQRAAKLQAPDIEDLGPLYYNGTEVLGTLDDKNYVGLEIQKYMQCLNDLKRGWTHYISPEACTGIEERLRVVLGSDAFRQSRALHKSVLVPDNIGIDNIRTYTRQVSGDEIFEDTDMKKF